MNKTKIAVASVLIAAATLSTTVHAVSLDWDNSSADGLWNTAANWSTDIVPAGEDDAVFIDPAVGPAVINADTPVARDIRFGDDGRVGSGTVNHTAGNATFNGWMRMGLGGFGSGGIYNLSGGQLTTSRYNIGESGASTGVVNVTGGVMRQSDVADINNGDSWNRIGQDGAGTLNLSGEGTVSLDSRTLVGAGAASVGLVDQTGGIFEIRRGELVLGDSSADAVYKISAGTLRTLRFHQDGNSGGNITVGEWDNSNGRMEIGGTATVQIATNFGLAQGRVDAPNQGTVVQTGGNVTFGGNGILTTGVDGAEENRSLGALLMASNPAGTATYTLSGGSLRQNDMDNREDQGSWNRIGQNGTAEFNISGGTASFDARTLIGVDAAAVATVNQTGGAFEVRNHELIIGDLGTATYNISGGTLRTLDPGRPINIGNWDNGKGTLNVSGTGQVISGQDLNMAGGQAIAPAQGTVNQTGGTVTTGRSLRMATVVGGVATYNLSGGELRQADAADIGNGDNWSRIGQTGEANFNISGGTASFDSRLLIGAGAESKALVTQTGGVFEVRRGEFTLGDGSADAVYKISAGTLRTLNFNENGDTGGNITVGQWDNSNGRLEISGTAVVQAATNVQIANGRVDAPNTGTIVQSGGTFTFGGNGVLNTGEGGTPQDRSFGGLQMATERSGIATYDMSGGVLRQNDMTNREDQGAWNRIGDRGTATFNLSGGTVSFDSRTHVGANNSTPVEGEPIVLGNGTVNQTGGTFEVRRHELIIGDGGQGTYNISGGTLQTLDATRPIVVGHWDNSVGRLNVSGTGAVIAAGDLIVGNGEVLPTNGIATQNGGTVTVGANLVIAERQANATGVYNLQAGVLDLTGGSINTGLGTGTFNMTGGELIHAGSIEGNSATAPQNADAFVQAGGVLVVGADDGAGNLTNVFGNYSLLAAGTTRFDIATGVSDLLNVTGSVSLAGKLELATGVLSTFPQTFTILDNDGTVDLITGTFSNAPDDTIFEESGYRWTVNYQGGDGNDVALTLVEVVPEPSTAALLIAGMAFGIARRRRKAA